MRKMMIAALAATMLCGSAQANQIYAGYSLDGGQTITEAGSSGAESFGAYFVLFPGQTSLRAAGTGAPATAQGTLLSNSTTVSLNTAETINIYLSETGNTLPASTFMIGFGNNSLSSTSVQESAYVTAGNVKFGRANLLASELVAPGTQVSRTVAAPSDLGSLYTLTSVYTITYPAGGGSTTSTLNVNVAQGSVGSVPEPASWAMMITGFGLVGAAMRRRKVAVRFA